MRDWSDRPAMATFDLHGQTVSEGAVNAERFLRAQQRARRGGVVRIITGRGRAGGGAPLRTRVRTLLRALRDDGPLCEIISWRKPREAFSCDWPSERPGDAR